LRSEFVRIRVEWFSGRFAGVLRHGSGCEPEAEKVGLRRVARTTHSTVFGPA